jgi:hypothetical protein
MGKDMTQAAVGIENIHPFFYPAGNLRKSIQ